MNHLTVPFDADPHGNPASYRCVRCKHRWPVGTTPPATCQEPRR